MEKGRLVNTGIGGFLNPPTHPEHTWSVETGPQRNPDSCSSLSSAIDAEWLDESTRAKARAMLDNWTRPALESPEIQDWIYQVLGYFKGCYKGENWNVDKLRMLPDADPVLNADIHAGVNCIRKYYPEFAPTAEHFANAYWGTKQ